MEDYQVEYLRNNVGFHLNDLSIKRRVELNHLIDEIKMPTYFILAGLSFKSLQDWEKWGFGLFYIDNYIQRIYDYLDRISQSSQEDLENNNFKYNKYDYIGNRVILTSRLNPDYIYTIHFDDADGWILQEYEK